MDIEVSELKQVTIVTPQSDFDMGAADAIKRRLTELIDMGRVNYIDSSGLGALVAAMKHARTARGDVKLCALQSGVRSVFEMTRLHKVMSIHATRQEAVAS